MNNILSELHVEILECDTTECRSWWNQRDLVNPFARIYHVREGEGWICHHDCTFHLVPGRLFLIPSTAIATMSCPHRMLQQWLHFRAELAGGLDVFQVIVPTYELAFADCPPWAAPAIAHLWELLKGGNAFDLLEAESLLRSLIALFLRSGPGKNEDKISAVTRFKPAFELIERQLTAKLTLKLLARTVSLHPVYFSNEFTRRMGVTPLEYVRARRIERAKRLLLDPNCKLDEIAAQTGFADAFHLSRTFKKLTGVSPSVFRRNFNSLSAEVTPRWPREI